MQSQKDDSNNAGGKKSGKGNYNTEQFQNRQGRISQSSAMDSHSESDEAVDDKGANFQKRNMPFGGKTPLPGKNQLGGMN